MLAATLAAPGKNTIALPLSGSADRETATLEKHLQPILAALHLADSAQVSQVRAVLAAHLPELNAWHAQHDAELKGFWNAFNRARSAKDVAGADTALAQIDGVYAGFQPRHQKFLASLAAVLSPAQVETVKDTLTVNKVAATYAVYLQIFPTLTEAQKAVVLEKLKAAREQAMDAGSIAEKSAFFKKYKIQIEDGYLTAQGYDPKQARQNFAAQQKAAENK